MEHKILFQINGGEPKEFAECSDSVFSLSILLPTAEQYELAKESGATLSQVVFTDESGNSFRLFSEPKT